MLLLLVVLRVALDVSALGVLSVVPLALDALVVIDFCLVAGCLLDNELVVEESGL